VGFSSIRHIPIYVVSDMTKPVAACSMNKARMLIGLHGAILQTVNGRSGLTISSADILPAYVDPFLQLLTPLEASNSEVDVVDHPPAPCHRPMNDREVMEHLVRAACLTAHVQGGLDDQAIAELREIRHKLSDAIAGMTYPRPISGAVAVKMNRMLQIFTQAQADRKLDDVDVIRQIQALTW
jgi:hypothetical protein